MVQLVSSEDNSLGPLQSLNSILRTYDPKTHYLQLVSNTPPIVRLMEKKAQQEKALGAEKKAKQKRARAIGRSEVQVTWESAQGDLTHKIGLIRNIIERGDRVDIAFIHKPANSGTLLSGAALKRVQERYPATVREELADVAKEFKPDTKDQRMTMMYLEPTKDIRDAVLKKMDATDEEKSKLKEAKKMERRLKEEERLRKAKAREDK
jgi:translation initiation factor IF-3